MRKGKWVHTSRSGHGYVFDDELTDAQTVRVRLVDINEGLTGKTIRCKISTLEYVGTFITPITLYKVVTKDMKSLGLRKNPNVMEFKLNVEMKEPTPKKGVSDSGGIWCCRRLSAAKTLKKYFEKKYGPARIFECKIGNIMFENSYRTKVDSIIFIKEVEL